MNQKQEEHIDNIVDWFAEFAWDKYEKGSKEHGGNLFDKAGIIDMALEEAVDLVIYLFTLKQQIEKVKDFDKNKKYEK